ncbi:biopolymer transport protein ExbD/TolR [beta proteobacterium KB13]|jgi:biopolymer transport protein TolR|uniref:Biopolymer transporter ExbD n=2 Tax=OM43 clade TaxID=1233498 RepID=A0A0H4IY72_9PROT|nr:biopolymer transporter ExbD [Methylophilales bacterium MBRSF5]AKO65946.1 biopolymer transporter ExbD [Methylophilales bacterium MBRS-H7]AKO67266.1 biopolymer transporter ExbD [Methylophilales bacterium MBRSG12]EDZ64663.1 biopolymer transport protein ExbD/TolR [beta proteobacterium KB13]
MKKRRLMNNINVVPYIDVMLVLLVIFMVTAPMTNPGVVELPRVGQDLKQQNTPITVSVKKDGSLEMEGKKIKADALLIKLNQKLEKNPELSVVIAADKKTQYENVVTVMDLLKQNQIHKVGLLLKPEK